MPSLKETMLANLREMVKLQRAAHDSMFKFSVKKMWPLSLIAPQVDWIRIARMMAGLQEKCGEQKEFLAREQGSAPEADLPFLNLLPEYFNSLHKTAELLERAASYRQNVLEKKIKMGIAEWNSILKSYNEASDAMATVGIILYKAY
ncbi:MAG: hypothetical protein LBQ87_06875 [Candidatus Fibromonas sp.]|jgi:hypothetical protein|nr:hypothetical protein [Candidatus Fibromonas sp.]